MARFFLFLFCSLILGSCNQSEKPELHIFIWSDYLKPELIHRFEKKHNCRVIVDTYDSNESMYAKLKLGGVAYDIIFPSNYYLELLLRQQMVHRIDVNKIPNLKNLDPVYVKLAGLDSFESGIPFNISTTGIAYRNDKIAGFDPSWTVFSRRDLKGRMTMLNDLREALGAALLTLGYSINTVNENEINAAVNLLVDWKKNLAKFESEQYKNGIASAEYLISQGYGGDTLQVMQENSAVSFSYPKEGIIMSIDYIVIPQNASHLDLAHSFINFLLEPDSAAENIAFTFYLSPNLSAYPLLPDELKNNPVLFPSQEVLQKAEMIKDLQELTPLYNKAWDRVKASSP